MAYSIVLSACVAAPFIYHNYKAYRLFCDPPNQPVVLSHPAICIHSCTSKILGCRLPSPLHAPPDTQFRHRSSPSCPSYSVLCPAHQVIFSGFQSPIQWRQGNRQGREPVCDAVNNPIPCTFTCNVYHFNLLLPYADRASPRCRAPRALLGRWLAFCSQKSLGQNLDMVERTLGVNQPRPVDSIPPACLVPKHTSSLHTVRS
ncbi:hypothetical protein H2248_012585 [Termitomyces sp. 'cryptogamus']|nr:hypothetical protein H2248_012585 [Termitomyces sp. 'cryptogamus']